MSSDLVRLAQDWLAQDPDPRTREELRELLDEGDEEALRERFGAKLEFGTAGLRGELGAGPNRMNRVTVMRAAAGLAAVLDPDRHVVIGYDARHNSDVFARDTAAVLTGAGLRASLLPAPLPTPVLAFAVRHLGADAGVTVTASHNPPRDNGYKVYWGDGSQIVPPVDAGISAAIDAVGPVSALPLGSPDDPGWTDLGEEIVAAYLDAVTLLPLGDARELKVVYTPLHGVGGVTLTSAFLAAGFASPVTVEAQADPDPDFPTVAFPNPEEPGAMDLALELAGRIGADLVLANDPDADRCAVGVPLPQGGHRMLTGDEVGALLGEHVIRHTSGDDRLVATTIVSSSLLGKIAAEHGVGYEETLTGFKWIMKAGGGRGKLVYGYEEALGYSVGSGGGLPVHDKDGIGAALTVAGLAARAKRDGRTLLDLLDDQARRYGLHATSQLSVRVNDLSLIAGAMARLRGAPPVELGGRKVESAEDLSLGSAGLPPTDGIRYRLAGGARVVVRPSGTEPKLKCYLETVVPVTGEVADARAQAVRELGALTADLSAALGL
ncbi:phosphomannomutase [Planomonospora parontospora subsp. parontospora]|uniref:Phosphomannomutase n=2 Tax=Planomonospora parontospora TaxID=58119 RepID=A0AA37F3B1_9ACTN|nr:phospho-sugar mutase [Planomonospora parontospora]GGK56425.1 phosphomannomutase [Planomonospora parontospora]GII07253.1 phosphomannomutase [Planomonospora parontospora subsp. parontospora]